MVFVLVGAPGLLLALFIRLLATRSRPGACPIRI